MAEPLWKRNNNPGNIRNPNAKGFRVFGSMDEGMQEWKALMNRRYFGRGLNTLQSIINTYAPPSDNNNTPAYINFVSKRMGIAPDAIIDPENADQLAALASAMFQMETGHTWTPEEIKKSWGATITKKTPIAVTSQPTPISTTILPGSVYYPGSMSTYIGNGYPPAKPLYPRDNSLAWGLNLIAQNNKYVKPIINALSAFDVV